MFAFTRGSFGVAVGALLGAVAPLATALAQPAPPSQGGPQGVPVTIILAAPRDVPVLLRNVGLVQAYQSVLVRARVDGTLDSVNFAEGQDVKAGDVLAQIDPRPYQAVLDQATAKRAADEAQLANARLDLQRYSALARSDYASRQSVDTQYALVAQVAANIQGDQAAIDTAKLNLGFTRITAPLGGRVGLRLIDAGNLIHATDATGLVTITQIKPISVVFSLPQDTLPDVMQAMQAGKLTVSARSANNQTELAAGQLETIDNTIDQTTGTYKLKAVFANADQHLWPGQFVNVALRVRDLKDALSVPSAALQRGPDGMFVYTVTPDDAAAVQPVTVTQDDGKVAVIATGLAAGAQVVVNGQSKLQNGTRVAPKPQSS